MKVEFSAEFEAWMASLDSKGYAQIQSRILRIEFFDHFGDMKDLGEELKELRWGSGRRVYFMLVSDQSETEVFFILGGLKNEQKKSIKKARLFIERYKTYQT